MNLNTYTKKQAYLFVTSLWIYFYCPVVTAQNKYVIAVDEAYFFNGWESTVRELFSVIYAPLGIEPVVEFYPSLRGLKLVNEGQLDAESGRAANIGEQYPNLIKVAHPILQYKGTYLCLIAEECDVTEATRFAVIPGFEAGKKYCEKNKLNCLIGHSHRIIAKALESGTIDVLIASLNSGTKVLCTIKNKSVFYKNVEALNVTAYHYIHKKHRSLEPALAASIEKLVKRNEITQLFQNNYAANNKCLLKLIEL